MEQLAPTTRLFPCRNIVRHNDDITLTYRSTLLRATQDFFLGHRGGGAECEGLVTFPPGLRGRRIHIDLFRDRSRGIFSLEGPQSSLPLDHFTFSIIWEVSRRITTHLGTAGFYSPRLVEIATEQGIVYGNRNHDAVWGPRRFRCTVGRLGPATIYVP